MKVTRIVLCSLVAVSILCTLFRPVQGFRVSGIKVHTSDAVVTFSGTFSFTSPWSLFSGDIHQMGLNDGYWGMYPSAGIIDITMTQLDSSVAEIEFTADATDTVYNWTWAPVYPYISELSGELSSVNLNTYSNYTVEAIITTAGNTTVSANSASLNRDAEYVTVDGLVVAHSYDAGTDVVSVSVDAGSRSVIFVYVAPASFFDLITPITLATIVGVPLILGIIILRRRRTGVINTQW